MSAVRGQFEDAGRTIKPLVDKGLVPPNARRVIIDFEAGKAVRWLIPSWISISASLKNRERQKGNRDEYTAD